MAERIQRTKRSAEVPKIPETSKVPEVKAPVVTAPTVLDEKPESGVVTVACKMPHGLIIRNFTYRMATEAVLGGGYREFKQFYQVGTPVKINGNATRYGELAPWPIVGGYGITENVPADVWKNWLEDNKDSDYVKNGLIFAYESAAAVTAKAKEMAGTRSGLEPLNPNKDERAPKSLNPSVSDVTQAVKAA